MYLVKIISGSFLRCLGVLFFSVIAGTAYCNDKEELLKIQQYLNSLKHLAAKFIQVDSGNNTQRGKFFLSRPGKLRWEYQDPKRITIVFNGSKVFYHNKELGQRSEYKTQDSLIYFLISPNINFLNTSSDYYVQSFGKKNKRITLEIKKKHHSKDEVLVIRFNENPLKLTSIEIKGSLRIFIDSAISYQSLDKNLFRT